MTKALKKSERRAKGKPFLGKIHANREKKIEELKAHTTKVKRARKSPRLHMHAVLAGFRRGLSHQRGDCALLRIESVNTKDDANWYTGKRCCYVYHGKKVKRCVRWKAAPARRSTARAIWGRVIKPHGTSGTVRAKFSPNLPPNAIGKRIRVYLYPSRI